MVVSTNRGEALHKTFKTLSAKLNVKKDYFYNREGENNMNRLVRCTPYELEYLDPVMGQLSDGKWENSRQMEAYWMCNSLTNNGIEMQSSANSFSGTRSYSNPLYDLDDSEVRDWFANKLKTVVKEWLKDNRKPIDDWNRVNNDEVDYLRAGQTVAGAYKAYDSLKGRQSKEGKQIKVKVKKTATQLEVGDMIGTRKIVRVILPLTRRDELVTIVYDNDEVQRISAYDQIEIIKLKTIEQIIKIQQRPQ